MPENYRTVNATAVLKKDKEYPGNYRQVNLTLNPGKVIKQLILGSISRNVKGKKVIRSSRRGFSKGKSCLTKLISFCNGMTGFIPWEEQGILCTLTSGC